MTGRLALGGCVLLLQLLPAVASGEVPRLTIPQFVAQLDAWTSVIETAGSTAAARLAPSIPASVDVRVGGETFQVHFEWLRRALRGAPADTRAWAMRRTEVAERLRAIAREANGATAAPRSQPDARPALAAVLAQSRFQRAKAEAWQAELRRRIERWLSDIWEATVGRRVGLRSVAVFLAWAASIGAVLVLGIWLVRILMVRPRERRPLSAASFENPRKPGHVLGSEAASLVQAGRIREGARVAYRAAVHRLGEEGALRIEEARTPREYLQLLTPGHRRHATLAALTSSFERIWYGSREPAPNDGDQILALLKDLGCLSFHRGK